MEICTPTSSDFSLLPPPSAVKMLGANTESITGSDATSDNDKPPDTHGIFGEDRDSSNEYSEGLSCDTSANKPETEAVFVLKTVVPPCVRIGCGKYGR
jgi:hypothetical protein